MRSVMLGAGLVFALAGAVAAGEMPRRLDQPIHSMGQPSVWKRYGGAYLSLGGAPGSAGPAAYVGLYKDLLPSVAGIGLSTEGYAGGSSEGSIGGARMLADLRGLMVKAGLDWNLSTGAADWILSFNAPLRRGGLFGHGSLIRVDWIPGRGNSWQVGVLLPFERHMGRTRPRDTEVDLPRPPRRRPVFEGRRAEVEQALGRVREAARWVVRLTHVFWDDSREDRLRSLERTRREIAAFKESLGTRDALHPDGVSLAGEVARLHGEMARAFGLAVFDPSLGGRLHDAARAAMADEVILPYDRLFGRFKRQDSLLAFGVRARKRFLNEARRLDLGDAGLAAAADVFDGYLRALEQARAARRERLGGDSRLVFLPLQLVLQPWEHDTQAEIDGIIARAAGTPFSDGNRVDYLTARQFQGELLRSIHATEDYHVLWLHDYNGENAAGDVDRVGFVQAVDGYLAALTDRVREFDETRRLPVFMILLDEQYYELRKGRLYMDLLEDPLGHRLELPERFAALQARADRAQQALRRAVSESRVLQAAARRRGKRWLRRVVKVHVSVTSPVDFSYRTSRLVSHLPIAPDSVIRDHRKIAFRDVSEADPGRGEALYAGVAVGEQYVTATWEDRAVRVSGPALVTLKSAVRRVLLQNGFDETEIPPPLRAIPRAPDYDEQVAHLLAAGATARALEVHNDRGFERKDASLVNSLLYTLMPPGSLIVVPSPIWTDPVWAGQLVGAALRGCDVYVIAPSRANAPQSGFVIVARSREVFSRFFEIQQQLAPEIEAAGGRLRTGVYTRRAGLDDEEARLREVVEGYRRYSFLAEEFPLAASFFDGLVHGPRLREAALALLEDELPLRDVRERLPQMHRKTQFLATRESLLELAVLAAGRARPNDPFFRAVGGELLAPDEAHRLARESAWLSDDVERAHRRLPAEVRDRAIYYLTVGSLNKDTRGQVLDGEVLFVVSGQASLLAYTDFAALLGSTTWIEDLEQLDELLPPVTRLKRLISRWVRKAV